MFTRLTEPTNLSTKIFDKVSKERIIINLTLLMIHSIIVLITNERMIKWHINQFKILEMK